MREQPTLIIGGPLCRCRPRRRPGVASLIAMLYLLLFATLAVGFYAATTMSVQMSRNDRVVAVAQSAAESGLGFARRQLAVANVTPSATDPSATFTSIYAALSARCGGTTNMGGYNPTRFTSPAGVDTICVPGHSGTAASPTYNWMTLGGTGGGQARVTLTRSGNNVVVTAYGRSTSTDPIARAVQVTYKSVSASWVPPAPGILSRSPFVISNGARVSGGDVVVATAQNTNPLNMSGGAKIDKDFYYTANSKAPVISNGASVGGTIYANTPMPSFPTVDTSAFAAFVPSASAPQGPKVITSTSSIAATATLTNIRIKANANTSFGNSVTLNGVIYVESPNKVSFGGGVRVTGIIVTDNAATGSVTTNQITLDNGVRVDGLDQLDASAFAASENIATLKTMGGAVVLAPNYKLVLAGGSRTFNDTMVASQFDISNGYRGTINASLINLADTNFTMVGGGQITFSGASKPVTGLGGGAKLSLDFGSYLEVTP